MEKRILGRDLEVSEIGFGCMGMSHAYGTVSTQKEAEELIAKGLCERIGIEGGQLVYTPTGGEKEKTNIDMPVASRSAI